MVDKRTELKDGEVYTVVDKEGTKWPEAIFIEAFAVFVIDDSVGGKSDAEKRIPIEEVSWIGPKE